MEGKTVFAVSQTVNYALGDSLIVTVNQDTDGTALVPGTIYKFKVVAFNVKGSSQYPEYSNEIEVAASSLPVAP